MDDKEYLNTESEESYGGKHSTDDDFIIGKGFEIQDDSENKNQNNNRNEKKPKKWIGTVIILVILAFCIGVAITVSLFVFDFLGIGFDRDGKQVQIDINKGASTEEIAKKLQENGVIEFPMFFKVYSKLKGFDGQYKYGLYVFNNDYGYSKTAKVLVEDGQVAENVTVRIAEGSNVDTIADLLEEKGVCTRKDFIHSLQYDDFDYDFVKKIDENDVYYRLEGYLYPDTYNFYCYDSEECAHLAIEKMLSNLNKKVDKSLKMDIKNSGYSFHEILTMASIVELESGSHPDESPKVAAVFFNRLKNSSDFPTLGSSPTIKYPYGNGRYNTYTTKGLPPGPLCSMGINSIRAAANPEKDFDYYYFVTDKNMKFYYNKTLAQHNSTISKLKAKGQWIYEYIE